MPDTKISALNELAVQPASNDLLVLVDVSDTSMASTGTDKKIQYSNLLPSGSVVQSLYAQIKGIVNLGSGIAMPYLTRPTSSEGGFVMSQAITPLFATSRIAIDFRTELSASHTDWLTGTICVDNDSNALQCQAMTHYVGGSLGTPAQLTIYFECVPGSTATRTYSVRIGASSSATQVYLNAIVGFGSLCGDYAYTTLTINEIKA